MSEHFGFWFKLKKYKTVGMHLVTTGGGARRHIAEQIIHDTTPLKCPGFKGAFILLNTKVLFKK